MYGKRIRLANQSGFVPDYWICECGKVHATLSEVCHICSLRNPIESKNIATCKRRGCPGKRFVIERQNDDLLFYCERCQSYNGGAEVE